MGLLLLAACGNSGETPAPGTPGTPVEPGATVLQSLEVAGRTWRLSIGACVKERCPVVVGLVDGGRLVDSVELRVPATTQTATAAKVSRSWGIAPTVEAWQTGNETTYVGTALVPVSLPEGFTGVLTVQSYGFEHVKRSHRLLRAVDGKIHVAWEYDDPPGPTWSVSEVTTSGAIIWRGRLGEPNEADQVQITGLAWAAAASKVVETADAPIQLVVAGRYSSVPAARAAKERASTCLDDYLVLNAADFPSLGSGVVVAAGASDGAEAAALVQTLQSCQPGANASIAAVRRGQ